MPLSDSKRFYLPGLFLSSPECLSRRFHRRHTFGKPIWAFLRAFHLMWRLLLVKIPANNQIRTHELEFAYQKRVFKLNQGCILWRSNNLQLIAALVHRVVPTASEKNEISNSTHKLKDDDEAFIFDSRANESVSAKVSEETFLFVLCYKNRKRLLDLKSFFHLFLEKVLASSEARLGMKINGQYESKKVRSKHYFCFVFASRFLDESPNVMKTIEK